MLQVHQGPGVAQEAIPHEVYAALTRREQLHDDLLGAIFAVVGQERGPAFAAEARVDGPKLDQVTGLKHESSPR